MLANQITPQLAWKLSYPADTSCFRITIRRNSSKDLLIQGSLPTSYFEFTTPCRNSRENCLFLQRLCLLITSRRNLRENCFILGTLPACKLHHAVTRVGSTPSTPGTSSSSSTTSSSTTSSYSTTPCWFTIHTTFYFRITSRRNSR